jgi:hypothetical protein
LDTYRTVLSVHLLGLVVASGAAGVTHFAHHMLRKAETLSDAARWGTAMKHGTMGFPVAIVLLLGSGAYMVSDLWSWSASWVIGALTGLGLIVVLGEGVMGRYGRSLGKTIGGAMARGGDGPVPPELTRMLESPLALGTSFSPTLLMLGVVYVMTTKPGWTGVIVALAVPLAVSAALGLALPKAQTAPETATAPSQA